jgi:hypothetical protein
MVNFTDTSLAVFTINSNSVFTTETIYLPHGTREVDVVATATDSDASVQFVGNSALVTGSNLVRVTVTAADGKTTHVYTRSLYVLSNTDTSLAVFTINGKSVLDYESIYLFYPTREVHVVAVATDPDATVQVAGDTGLVIGENKLIVIVTAADEITTYIYGVTLFVNENVNCFNQNTKILTNKGYKAIQELRNGDLIKTFKHDFKPIVMIGKRDFYHPASKQRIKEQLYTCSQNNFPDVFEDLVISGSHSILVDDFISQEQREKVIEVNGDTYVTDNKYRLPACADPRASIYSVPQTCTIYHLALENDDYFMNYGIYANGLLVETCSKRYLKELSNMELIE